MYMTRFFILLIFILGGSGMQELMSQDWSQFYKAVADNRASDDLFGQSVSITDERVMIGAPGHNTDANGQNPLNNAGAAYFFNRQQSDSLRSWQPGPKVVASDREIGDEFGSSVAVDGDRAIVGAPLEDEDSLGNNTLSASGSAYIFERDGTGNWNQVAKVVDPERFSDDNFGASVALSGDWALVGAPLEDDDATGFNFVSNAGSAFLYRRDANGDWNLAQKIVASDRQENDRFGFTVSLEGDRALIGAPFEDQDADGNNRQNEAGSAYVFERDANNNWSQVAKLVADDRSPSDNFGLSVSISGNYAIIGAPLEDEDPNQANFTRSAGSAYFFERDNSGNWNQQQKVVASDRSVRDRFGSSVAINGPHAVVGAEGEDEDDDGRNFRRDAGSAYVWRLDGARWSEDQKIVAQDRGIDDNFSDAIAIFEEDIVVGAPLENENASGGGSLNNAGSAYIFSLFLDTIPPEIRTGTDTLYLDNQGLAAIRSQAIDRGTFDNVRVDTFFTIPDTIFCDDTGNVSIDFVATDRAGNADTQAVVITVRDTLAPNARARDITLFVDASGSAQLNPDTLDDGSTDNCAIDTRDVDRTSFGCDDFPSVQVVFTVRDPQGNTDQTTATINLEDTTRPIIRGRDTTLFLNQRGVAGVSADQLDDGSSDNCELGPLSLEQDSFRCDDDRDQLVTLSGQDASGNVNRDPVRIIIRDTIAPSLQLPNDTSICVNDPSSLNFDFEISSNDNCDATVSTIQSNLNDLQAGGVRNYQIYEARDPSGNVTRDSFFIQITEEVNAAFTADTLDSLRVRLQAENVDQSFYQWSLGDGNQQQDTANFVYTYDQGGEYLITLTAGLNDECQDEQSQTVVVTQPEGFCQVPTAFSPNGDDINDVWEVQCDRAQQIEWLIFDRWGQLQAQGVSEEGGFGWEGTNDEGEPLEEGVYLYEVCWLQDDELGRGFQQCARGILELIR